MYTTNNQPQAHVTVGKNRPKKGDKVYLKSGQEFEVELFNPLTETILAQIWLNDEAIGGGGIVLRPGEKVYLERYLDKAKKFKFETYEVAANNTAVDNAIRNNGKVKIQFFKEIVPSNGSITIINDGNWYNGWPNYNSPSFPSQWPWGTTTCKSTGANTLTSGNTSNAYFNCSADIQNCNSLSFSSDVNMDSLKDTVEENQSNTRKLSKKVKETGRIEEGGNSNQSFTYVNKSFSTWAFQTVEYQILPISVKQITKADIKNYCTNCGVKQKKGWNFCPKCRTQFE